MPENKKHVLIVDRDRLATLISQMLIEKYSTDAVNDGLKAVNRLRELLPSVIVADVDIPGSGISLAELVGISPRYSHVPIILMSANPSPEMILRARSAGAHSYLAKPFGPRELQRRIDDALSASPRNASEEIRNRVQKIEKLPAFPATHAEILQLARSEDATSEEIAEKLQLDPMLLATVFKLVNSTYYAFQKKIDSLTLAVTLLGLEEVANLVMSAQVFEKLGTYEDGAGLDLEAFWKHAVGTAFIVRTFAKKRQIEPESAFLAGMLHDLGKIVLDRCFADYYKPVIEKAREEEIPLYQAEQAILGLTHAEVGAQLAAEWQFADSLLDVIANHHRPEKSTYNQTLVDLVHLADVICRQLQYGSGGDNTQPQASENVLRRLSLGQRGHLLLKEAARQDLQYADSFLNALKS